CFMPPGSRFLKIPLFIGFWSTTSLWQTSMMYIHTYIFYLKYFFLAIEYFNSHSRSVAIIHPSQVCWRIFMRINLGFIYPEVFSCRRPTFETKRIDPA